MAPSYRPITGKEPAVRCPFNPEHVMLQTSLQRHIIRCMKNYPHWVSCPYNAMHRFPNKRDLADHMLECPSKADNDLFHEPEDTPLNFKHQAPYHLPNIRKFNLAEEDWDAD